MLFPTKRHSRAIEGLRVATHSPVLVPRNATHPAELRTCLARGGNKVLKPHIDVHLHPQQQSHLQQDQLQLPDTWEGERPSGLHP